MQDVTGFWNLAFQNEIKSEPCCRSLDVKWKTEAFNANCAALYSILSERSAGHRFAKPSALWHEMIHQFSLSRKSLLEIFTHPTTLFFPPSLSGPWVAVGRCRTKDKSALFSLTGNSRAEQHLSPLIHYPTLHLAPSGHHTSSFLDLSLGLITHPNLQWADINEL